MFFHLKQNLPLFLTNPLYQVDNSIKFQVTLEKITDDRVISQVHKYEGYNVALAKAHYERELERYEKKVNSSDRFECKQITRITLSKWKEDNFSYFIREFNLLSDEKGRMAFIIMYDKYAPWKWMFRS